MRLKSVQPHRGRIHTPLRYPGGKTRLFPFLRDLVKSAGWTNFTYAEPYAGGAGAALSLLSEDVVGQIAINDLDPAIAAFWHTVTSDSEWFIDRIRSVPLTLDEWDAQKLVYKNQSKFTTAEVGFATFFLNRTNRSGVMNAGVIGGRAQAGDYKIDARFNRSTLAERISSIGRLRDRILVSSEDGAEFITRHLDDGKTFVYADPPYYEKGSYLYMNAFDNSKHAALAKVLNDRPDAPWMLTYDDAPEIRALYRGRYQGIFELPYSAHRSVNFAERMIVSSSVARHMREFTTLLHS